MRCATYSADGDIIWLEWRKSPTKIRVYGSKQTTDRNVSVQIVRKWGGVKVVSMKLPVLLQAVSIERYICRTKGLT